MYVGDYSRFRKKYENPILKSRTPGCTTAEAKLGATRLSEVHRVVEVIDLDLFHPSYSKSPKISYFEEKQNSSGNTSLRNVSPLWNLGQKTHRSQGEYVVFITPTRVQNKIFKKILTQDNLDPLIKNSADSLAMMGLLQKICNSPILLKATADKNKGKNQDLSAGAILDALAYLPARPQVEDISLSGLTCSLCLIGMYADASIREAYGTR